MYNTAIIGIGEIGAIVTAAITATIGAGAIAIAIQGWLLQRVSIFERIIFFAGGLLLMMPEIGIAALGSTFVVAVSMYQWVQTRSKEPKGTDTENAE